MATAQIEISAPLQLDRLNQIFRFSSFNRRKFAAVTLRLYLPLGFLSGLRFENFYPAVAWLCWVPNLVVAEWTTLRTRTV